MGRKRNQFYFKPKRRFIPIIEGEEKTKYNNPYHSLTAGVVALIVMAFLITAGYTLIDTMLVSFDSTHSNVILYITMITITLIVLFSPSILFVLNVKFAIKQLKTIKDRRKVVISSIVFNTVFALVSAVTLFFIWDTAIQFLTA